MIRIVVERDEKRQIAAFTVHGHASSPTDDNDIDLLCCAVSVLTQGCAMGLSDVAKIEADEFTIEKGRLYYRLPDELDEAQRHDASVLLESMCISLRSLAQSSANFVQISDEGAK